MKGLYSFAHNMPQLSVNSVSYNGITDTFGYDKADLRWKAGFLCLLFADRHEYSWGSATSTLEGSLEFDRAPHPVLGWKHVSGRERVTTLAATCCENGASGASCHALTEAVHLGATAIIRLESPLGHGSSPCR